MKHFIAAFIAATILILSMTASAANPLAVVPRSHWAYQDLAILGGFDQDDSGMKDSVELSRYEIAMHLAVTMKKNAGKILVASQREALERLAREFQPELRSLGASTELDEAILAAAKATLEMQQNLDVGISLDTLAGTARNHSAIGKRPGEEEQRDAGPKWSLEMPSIPGVLPIRVGANSEIQVHIYPPSLPNLNVKVKDVGVSLDQLRSSPQSFLADSEKVQAKLPLVDGASITLGYEIGKEGKGNAQVSVDYTLEDTSLSASYRLINFDGLVNTENSVGAEVSVKF